MPYLKQKNLRRVVVKVGSALLTRDDNQLNEAFLEHFADQIAKIHAHGISLVIVTSGSVAAGRGELILKKESKNIPYRQALSAVGQSILMDRYHQLLKKKKIKVAQALLTDLDFQNRESFLNTQGTLNLLLDLNVIPVVNENDVVAYEGFKFGGNDPLAAKVSTMIQADAMVLLTDVDGLFDHDPRIKKNAQLLTKVKEFTPRIKAMAKGISTSRKSLGGMITKLESAEFTSQAGLSTVIANGNREGILLDILAGREFIGTLFEPLGVAKGSRKVRMQNQMNEHNFVTVDDGAAAALTTRGASLLPAGVVGVDGCFHRGDIVGIKTKRGKLLGFGRIHYGSMDVKKLMGCHTSEIAQKVDLFFENELMHRDNMVILK